MGTSDSGTGIKVVHCMREPYTVYIGRRNVRKGLPESKWANKFRIGPDGDRAEVLRKYRAWLLTQKHLMADLHELEGQTLGCWCLEEPVMVLRKPEDQECHGEILMEMVHNLRRGCDPYTEGVEAAHSNKTAAHCPYSYDSLEGEQWMLGYQNSGGQD